MSIIMSVYTPRAFKPVYVSADVKEVNVNYCSIIIFYSSLMINCYMSLFCICNSFKSLNVACSERPFLTTLSKIFLNVHTFYFCFFVVLFFFMTLITALQYLSKAPMRIQILWVGTFI